MLRTYILHTYSWGSAEKKTQKLITIIIIPLLRHFTIFGQENAQNMSR